MLDTTLDAAAIQTRILRSFSGERRFQEALDMSLFMREVSLSRLRKQHPDWKEFELKRELLRYAFDFQPLPPPLR